MESTPASAVCDSQAAPPTSPDGASSRSPGAAVALPLPLGGAAALAAGGLGRLRPRATAEAQCACLVVLLLRGLTPDVPSAFPLLLLRPESQDWLVTGEAET